MTLHTPGPWHYSTSEHGVIDVFADDGACHIATVDTENIDEIKYAKADARLIAAAPELLRALEQVRDFRVESRVNADGNEMLDNLAEQFEALQAVAQAAIVKAETL